MKIDVYRRRIESVQATLRAQGFDGILVVKPENVRYVSGFWGYSARPEYAMPRRLIAVVIPASGDCTLIVPKIERLFAQRRSWLDDVRYHVEWASEREVFGGLILLSQVLREKGLHGRRLGIEAGFVSMRLHELLCGEFPDTAFEDATSIIEQIRMIKSPEEIEILRIGGRMVVKEYEAEAGGLKAGIREFELALRGREEGTRLLFEASDGHDADLPLAHPILDGMQIITSGKRLDMAHALASTRRIESGDVVLLDFCRLPQYEGYRLGFARMVSLRRPSSRDQDLFKITMQAYHAAVDLVRPGVPAEEPDLAAREILDKAGLGETVVHRTGRGVGLEVVEKPEIGAGDKTVLAPGMVVTIEPSIYYQDFAVHVEDTFLVTNDGCEWLTQCPRELKVLQQ